MGKDVYRTLCETMSRRGGIFPGMDIPEFYDLARELFTEEEAEISNAMPRGFNPPAAIAKAMGKKEDSVARILEDMANKGLCFSMNKGGTPVYAGIPFVPGIFEYQFMRGSETEKDKRIAKLIYAYKSAVNAKRPPPKETFPAMRVITVDRTIEAGNKIHTYDQVASYIEATEPLAVSTCYCRHQAKLVDAESHCGSPDEVCLQLGAGAQFVIDRRMGRQVSKAEAMEILEKAEEAGLVHCSNNRQEVDFLCNCCSCHCVILKSALAHPKPGLFVNSGFQPVWDPELCTACETCIERCPMEALSMGQEDLPEVNLDRCIGCGVCATGCPAEAVRMEQRPGIPAPPLDRKALKEAIQAGMT